MFNQPYGDGMPGLGRRRALQRRINLLPIGCLVLFHSLCLGQTLEWPVPPNWYDDAQLTDICMINQQQGWVVGDRGLVLRTDDGGQTWQQVFLKLAQNSNSESRITCRLESVFFISETQGWIAGGYHYPNGSTSSGVMFRTNDGGAHWQALPGIAIPKINDIHFFNHQDGIAFGESNALKPNGVYMTKDGGVSWSTDLNAERQSWKRGCLFDDRVFLIGDHRTLGLWQNNQLQPSIVSDTRPVQVNDAIMLDDQFGYAAADHGRLLQTINGGHSWHPAELNQGLPVRGVDYKTIALHGSRMWLAGKPGNQIYRMDASTRTWQSSKVNCSTAIQRIQFVDQQTGWAISSGGDILRSTDGGVNWNHQRRGISGVALLHLGDRPQQFFPEIFSRYCAEENYLGSALMLKIDPESGKSVTENQWRTSISRVGGSFSEIADFSAFSIENQTSLIVEYLVREFRSLRPRVVCIPSTNSLNDAFDLRTLTIQAVKAAGDRRQFPDHIDQLGLEPWDVGKIMFVAESDTATIKISAGQALIGMSTLVSDHCAVSRLLLNKSINQPQPVSLTNIYTSPYAAGSDSTLFGSIENTDARVPTRRKIKFVMGNLIQMRQLSKKKKTINEMLEKAPNQVDAPALWNRELAELVAKLDQRTAGVWLTELAFRCEQNGYTELAVTTHLYLTDHLRKHPLAVNSLHWLYRYYASAEYANIAAAKLSQRNAAALSAKPIDGAIITETKTEIFEGLPITQWQVVENDPRQETGDVASVGHTGVTQTDLNELRRRRLQQARSIGQSYALLDNSALYQGRAQLLRIGLNQRLDSSAAVGDQLRQAAANRQTHSALADLIASEIRIVEDDRTADVLCVQCGQAAEKPLLDGKFDDSIWNQTEVDAADPLPLWMDGEPTDDQVQFSADNEFLYVAVRCRLSSSSEAFDTNQPRKRDANLSTSDRVEIAIDIDRDTETSFLFSVDSAGRVADSLGNNLAWNPEWYVAASRTERFWQVEMAIPRSQLDRMSDSSHWLIAVNRYIHSMLISSTDPEFKSSGQRTRSAHVQAIYGNWTANQLPISAMKLLSLPTSRTAPANSESVERN